MIKKTLICEIIYHTQDSRVQIDVSHLGKALYRVVKTKKGYKIWRLK